MEASTRLWTVPDQREISGPEKPRHTTLELCSGHLEWAQTQWNHTWKAKQRIHLEPGSQPREVTPQKEVKAGQWIKSGRPRRSQSRKGDDSVSVQLLGIKASMRTDRQGKILPLGAVTVDKDSGQEMAYTFSAWAVVYPKAGAPQGEMARDVTEVWQVWWGAVHTWPLLADLVDGTEISPLLSQVLPPAPEWSSKICTINTWLHSVHDLKCLSGHCFSLLCYPSSHFFSLISYQFFFHQHVPIFAHILLGYF